MAKWTFDVDADGWTPDWVTGWTVSDGSPGLGCLQATDVSSMSATISGSWSVDTDDPYSFRFRVIISDTEEDFGVVTVTFLTGGADNISQEVGYGGTGGLDSGWQYVSGTYAGPDTKTDLTVQGVCTDGISATIRIDSIYLAEAPPGGGNYGVSGGGIPGAVLI